MPALPIPSRSGRCTSGTTTRAAGGRTAGRPGGRSRTAAVPTTGPSSSWLVAACKAPDGSYWALQRWQRLLPMRGVAPFRPGAGGVRAPRLALVGAAARARGLAELDVRRQVAGALRPAHLSTGARSSGSAPRRASEDPNARFFYVDTFNSVFGTGWRHDAGKVAHSRNGAFCYSFVPQLTPPGYPTRELRPPGNGERHRVTVMGPGVTPVIQWEAALGRYDPQQDAVFNALFDRIVDRRPGCVRAQPAAVPRRPSRGSVR